MTGAAISGVARALEAAATALEGSAAELNELDGYAGDGDLGITMSEAARVLREVIASAEQTVASGEQTGLAQLLSSCGAAIARSAPSTSGTLVATGFLRAAKAVTGNPAVLDAPGGDVEMLERSFTAAMEGIQARGKASLGDRTMLDGLNAVCASMRGSVAERHSVPEALSLAAQAASTTAAATADMVPKVGRASWAPQRAVGHPDAGCAMLAIAMRAVASEVAANGLEGPTGT